jgi:glycosyltransferase involved in cell wall biosynthesis
MNTNLPRPAFSEIGVIALVPDRWSAQWQARHQIARRLARYFQVVWMDYPLSRRDSLRQFFGRKMDDRSTLPDSFQVYRHAPWLPELGRPAWLGRWTSQRRLRQACRLLRARGCSKIVLYLWRPEFAPALSQLAHHLSCYHIDDEYSFSPVEAALDPAEIALLRSSGQVFIHSPALLARKGSFNSNTEFVPNGVDYQSYATPAPEPQELTGIRRPRIGYIGTLKKMLNWPLLLELSTRHPEWSFVFVGNVAPHAELPGVLSVLAQRGNVHILAAKPSEALPGYVQHCDVCIMPYRLDDYTKYIYPLKLHEYLASGRPVVGTHIPSIEAFEDTVLLADGPEEWSSAIERALSPDENTYARCEARRRIARMHDWDVLVEKIAITIARRLGYALPVSQTALDQVSGVEDVVCSKVQ